ncbi:MAG: hypothetical protein NUV53_04785 [Patescibacteria group bacterium]|nr:hypothetical protein [Patescibacteria group bacterium]
MNQKELKLLLQEAASPDCPWQRRNEIQCKLGEASPAMRADGVYEIDGREAGMHLVLNQLYVDTIQNRPDLLPSLFPAFAVICGDREEGIICADVDWLFI